MKISRETLLIHNISLPQIQQTESLVESQTLVEIVEDEDLPSTINKNIYLNVGP